MAGLPQGPFPATHSGSHRPVSGHKFGQEGLSEPVLQHWLLVFDDGPEGPAPLGEYLGTIQFHKVHVVLVEVVHVLQNILVQLDMVHELKEIVQELDHLEAMVHGLEEVLELVLEA